MTEKNTGKNSIFPQNLAKALDIKCSIRAKFAASQPRSLAASQPRSLAASQPRSLAASQPRSLVMPK